MAALLDDKSESIPLGLEDPLFIVESFVDERREHRSISGIHPFSVVGRRDSAGRAQFIELLAAG